MNISDKIFLTFDEAAELCSVSKSTIEKAVRQGHLRKIKIGKLARIDREHLEAWRRDLAGTPTALDCLPLVRTRSEVIEKTVGTK